MEMLKILSQCLATLSVTWWGKSSMKRKKENRENVANKNEKKIISPQKCKGMRAKILPSNEKKKILTIKKEEKLITKKKIERYDDDLIAAGKRWLKPTTRELSKNVATSSCGFSLQELPPPQTVFDHNLRINFA